MGQEGETGELSGTTQGGLVWWGEKVGLIFPLMRDRYQDPDFIGQEISQESHLVVESNRDAQLLL